MTKLIPIDASIAAVREYIDDTGSELEKWDIDQILHAIPAIDPAAIREAALREAAELVRSTAYTSNGDNRSLEPVATGLAGMDMHHATIAAAILALIGEKK